jgi:leader peptidase (prepilin peptidase) / N-methyltransferase
MDNMLPLFLIAPFVTWGGVVDWKTGLIPNPIILVVALISVGVVAWTGFLLENLLAPAVMIALLMGLRAYGQMRYGIPGIGMGDVKLLAAISIALGWSTFWMLHGACMIALIIYAIKRERVIRFGPAIAISLLVFIGYHAVG